MFTLIGQIVELAACLIPVVSRLGKKEVREMNDIIDVPLFLYENVPQATPKTVL